VPGPKILTGQPKEPVKLIHPPKEPPVRLDAQGRPVILDGSGKPLVRDPVVRKQPTKYPIPQGGISIEERLAEINELNKTRYPSKQLKIPEEALTHPEEWYFDRAANAGKGEYKRLQPPPVDLAVPASPKIPCFPASTLVSTPQGFQAIKNIAV